MSTRRRILYAVMLGLAIALAGLLMRQGDILALGLPFLVYAIALTLSDTFLRVPCFRVSRMFSATRVHEDEQTTVTCSVAHDDARDVLFSLEDEIPVRMSVVDGESRIARRLASGQTAETTYTVEASRGRHTQRQLTGAVWARTGLAIRDVRVGLDTQLSSLPQFETLRDIQIRPRRTHAFAGSIRTDRPGSGLEILGCREYVLGDDIRKINWRASARREELIVNLFEQEKMTDVNIIVDARASLHLQIGSARTFDIILRGAASVASHFLRQGNRVGLLLYGDSLNWTYPASGRLQMESILHSLARARPSSREAFGKLRYIPARLFATGSELIIFSALGSEEDIEVPEQLVARGYSVLLVHPDSTKLERAESASERYAHLAERFLTLRSQVVLSKLARAGVVVVNWNLAEPLGLAFHHAQTITRGVRR